MDTRGMRVVRGLVVAGLLVGAGCTADVAGGGSEVGAGGFKGVGYGDSSLTYDSFEGTLHFDVVLSPSSDRAAIMRDIYNAPQIAAAELRGVATQMTERFADEHGLRFSLPEDLKLEPDGEATEYGEMVRFPFKVSGITVCDVDEPVAVGQGFNVVLDVELDDAPVGSVPEGEDAKVEGEPAEDGGDLPIDVGAGEVEDDELPLGPTYRMEVARGMLVHGRGLGEELHSGGGGTCSGSLLIPFACGDNVVSSSAQKIFTAFRVESPTFIVLCSGVSPTPAACPYGTTHAGLTRLHGRYGINCFAPGKPITEGSW